MHFWLSAEEMPDSARALQAAIRGPHSLVGQHVAEVVEVIKQSKEEPVTFDPHTAVSVLEQNELKTTSITQASNHSSSEIDTANKITTQESKTVTETSVPKLMEEAIAPASADFSDIEMKSTTVVEEVVDQELPPVDSKAEQTETTSIKEISVGPSISAVVMVKRSSIEDNCPASTINIPRQNVAVVKRASGPSLALFGGASKKKGSARTADTNTKAKAVETSLRPDSSNPMIDPEAPKLASESLQASKLPNAVVQSIPEIETVTAVSKDDGIKASAEAVPSAPSEVDKLTGAAVGSGEAVQSSRPDGTRMILDGGKASVTSVGSLSISRDVAFASVEHEQESQSTSAAEALLHDGKSLEDVGRCNEASPNITAALLSGSRSGEDVVMVAAEEENASGSQGLKSVDRNMSPGGTATLEARPADEGAIVRRTSGAAGRGLGSMLGSSAHRKRQKKSTEDMEMVRLLPMCFYMHICHCFFCCCVRLIFDGVLEWNISLY